jgi:NADH dehydrogenase
MPYRTTNRPADTIAVDGGSATRGIHHSLTATGTHRTDPRPHVVIIGGGFAGLSAARALANAPVRITLLDRTNHHLFQPLLYQVATAVLNPADISVPIRWLLRNQQNATVVMAEVDRIDPQARTVSLDSDTVRLSFDYLVVRRMRRGSRASRTPSKCGGASCCRSRPPSGRARPGSATRCLPSSSWGAGPPAWSWPG